MSRVVCAVVLFHILSLTTPGQPSTPCHGTLSAKLILVYYDVAVMCGTAAAHHMLACINVTRRGLALTGKYKNEHSALQNQNQNS